MNRTVMLSAAALVVLATACDKKQSEGHSAPPVTPAPTAREAPPPAAPFATLEDAAAASGRLMDQLVGAANSAAGDCGKFSAGLTALAPEVESVGARLGTAPGGANARELGLQLMGKISCFTPAVAKCLGNTEIEGFFASSGWVAIRHAAVVWAGPGAVPPPCTTPLKTPHPPAVSDAAAAEQDALAAGFTKMALEVQAAADCKSAAAAIKRSAAATPKDALARRNALMMSEDEAVMSWYMGAYNQRYGQALVAMMDVREKCKAEPAWASAAKAHPFGMLFE